MENGLACLATKLIALLAVEEITEKQALKREGEGGRGCYRMARRAPRQPGRKRRKHSLTSFAGYLLARVPRGRLL